MTWGNADRQSTSLLGNVCVDTPGEAEAPSVLLSLADRSRIRLRQWHARDSADRVTRPACWVVGDRSWSGSPARLRHKPAGVLVIAACSPRVEARVALVGLIATRR